MKQNLLLASLMFLFGEKGFCQYWEALGGGVSGIGVVEALMPDTFHHKLYAGGVFNLIGGVSVYCMAYWDGNAWHALSHEPGNAIVAFAMKEDTLIYVTSVASDTQVGKYVDTTFIGYLPKVGNIAYCSYVFHDTLYVGGSFNGGIKYWNGTTWKKLGDGVSGSYLEVLSIGSYNNQLIVGGTFTSAGGVAVNNIAAWDGSTWNDMGGGVTWPGDNAYVEAIQEWHGKLYVGGNFFYSGGVNTRDNAIWNGESWDTLAVPNIGGSCGDIKAFYADSNMLYATGSIAGCCGCPGDIGGMYDGTTWYNMYLGVGNAGYAITVFNGEVIAGSSNKYGYNGDTLNYVSKFLGYPTAIANNNEEASPSIFPNPVSTTIQIHLPSNQPTILTIFNLLGEKMREEKVSSREVTIDVSDLPAGMYVVRTEKEVVGKFVKK